MKDYNKHLINAGSTIKNALFKLNELAQDAILFVVDKNKTLIGALTDGDIRRGLLKGINIEESIDNIIQPNPRFIKKGEIDVNRIVAFREGLYRIIPVLDTENRVIKVINFREQSSYLPVDAVIMAGGRGERLLPMTKKTPKPLLVVGEKPIIEHNLDRLSFFGIDNFWISLNYLGNLIENHFGNGVNKGIKINYVREDKPLGTIGAVSLIEKFNHDYILITNSDILTNLNYEHFFLQFIDSNAEIGVVTIPYNISVPYAVFETKNNRVLSFKEKPTYTYYSNGGIYLLKKSVLKYLPQSTFFNATDLLEKLLLEKKQIFSYPLMDYWLDIGNHTDFAKAQNDYKSIRF